MVAKVFLYGFEGVLCSCLENVRQLLSCMFPSYFLGYYMLYNLSCGF